MVSRFGKLDLVVALRKESVDRNNKEHIITEIPKVALRKESVDRNLVLVFTICLPRGRSPQGERG